MTPLSSIADDSEIGVLGNALNHKYEDIQQKVADALSEKSEKRVLSPSLAPTDPSPEIRNLADELLKKTP